MKNNFYFNEDKCFIEIKTIEGMKEVVIDKDDFEKVSKAPGTWYSHRDRGNGKFYVYTDIVRKGKRKRVLIHRLVLGIMDEPDLVADHLDHNSLNNTKENLKATTRHANAKRKQDFVTVFRKGDTWKVKSKGKEIFSCSSRKKAQQVRFLYEAFHFPHLGEFKSFDLLFKKYDIDSSIYSNNVGSVGKC